MKILVDENIPGMTVLDLRRLGHDVRDIRKTDQEGLSDADLWRLSQVETRLLITTDKGFAQYRNVEHSGLLIVRLKKPNRRRIHDSVMTTLNKFSETEWIQLMVVVRDNVQSIWKAGERK